MTADEYHEKEKKILEYLPKELQSYFSYEAYERGHAYGYEEVLLILRNSVEGFKQPFEQYKERIACEYKNQTNNL